MANVYRGTLDGKGLKVGIAVSRFNETITAALLAGALDRLERLGVEADDIDVAWVPGAFELPQAVHLMDQAKSYDGLMALGCVIRGETSHFEHVAGAASRGLTRFGLSSQTPLGFGVLTCDTVAQAQARAGLKSNKGAQTAESLIELIHVLRSIRGKKR